MHKIVVCIIFRRNVRFGRSPMSDLHQEVMVAAHVRDLTLIANSAALALARDYIRGN